MAFDAQTVKGIIDKADTSAEDKVKLLMGEHEAETRGLVTNKNELLEEKKTLEGKLKAANDKAAEATATAAKIEEELKKNAPEELQKVYASKLETTEREYKAQIEKLTADNATLKTSHYQRLFSDEIAEGIKDIPFTDDVAKKSFINNIRMEHTFEPKELNGQVVFVNKDGKTFSDIAQGYKLSDEGRHFIANQNRGGGAPGSSYSGNSTAGVKTITREQFDSMGNAERTTFFKEGGKIA